MTFDARAEALALGDEVVCDCFGEAHNPETPISEGGDYSQGHVQWCRMFDPGTGRDEALATITAALERAYAAGLAAGLERGAKIARERATCARLLCVHESCMGAREAADEIDGELDAERERTRGEKP